LCVMYVADNLTVGFRKSEYLHTKKKQDRNEDSIYQWRNASRRSVIHFSGICLGLFTAPFFVWMVLWTSAVKLLRTAETTRSKVRVVC
jgi:predicted membrane channel-forming protein YqfA (hemolysin III family)